MSITDSVTGQAWCVSTEYIYQYDKSEIKGQQVNSEEGNTAGKPHCMSLSPAF